MMPVSKHYADFEIRVGPKLGNGFPFIARGPDDSTTTSGYFQEPYTASEIDSLLSVLQTTPGGDQGSDYTSHSEIGQALESLGRTLYDSLFDQTIGKAYKRALDRSDGAVRLKLVLPQPQLARLPWEYLHDGDRFLGLDMDTPIVRGVISQSWASQPMLPLRLLILGSCPVDQAPLEIAVEYRTIERELQKLEKEGQITIRRLWGSDVARDLPQHLLEFAPHVLHFAGHGSLEELILQNSAGQSRMVTGTSLRDLLGNIKSLQLVVLNACELAGIQQTRRRQSVAARLVQVGMPMAVGMQFRISDAAALAFSEGFYEALAQGLPLEAAAVWARVRISYYLSHLDRDTIEWGTPVIYVPVPATKVDWRQTLSQALARRFRHHTAPQLPTRIVGQDGKEMRLIPAGTFMMGNDQGAPDEAPAHRVQLPGYWIDRYPVTNAEYARFVETTGHSAPSHWNEGRYPTEKANHPVTNVSWQDATAYAKWAGKRLPREAEWEKAARGSDGRLWPWGNVFHPPRANTREAGIGDTTPIDAHPLGVSPYEVADMAGNVWEWTQDLYRPYPGSHHDCPSFYEPVRVLRGGSWSYGANDARCSTRTFDFADFTFERYGFRCVVDAKMIATHGNPSRSED